MKFHNQALLALVLGTASVSKITLVSALTCGEWNTHACLGDTDKRYDSDYNPPITEQNELWVKQAGFWKATQTSDQVQSRFNPLNLTAASGIPYDDNECITFVNITFSGSRAYEQRYLIFPPSDQTWCDENPFEPPLLNSLDGGICGVNGYATFSEEFKVSSYEKDGSLIPFGRAIGASFYKGFVPSGVGNSYPVGDRVITEVINGKRPDGGEGTLMKTWLFLDDEYNSARAVQESYNSLTSEVFLSRSILYERISDEATFLQEIEDTKAAFNVKVSNVLDDLLQVPMTRACIGDPCPTEGDWCTFDPLCSESPYQEPKAKVRADVIAGLAVGAAAILIGIIVAHFIWRLKEQQKRMKLKFAARVAETIDLEGSLDMILSPEALKAEFERIDAGHVKDGKISKDELWEFMSGGSVGTITENEFEALYRAIDLDKSGSVDFLEFCHFLTLCGKDFDRAVSEVQKKSPKKGKDARMNSLSKSLVEGNVRKSQRLKIDPKNFVDDVLY